MWFWFCVLWGVFFAPVSVAGCGCWYSVLIVLIPLIPSGWSCSHSPAITRKLLVSFPPGTFYTSKNPLLALSWYFTLFHLREAERFLISMLSGLIINLSFSLLCHRLFVFCFPALSLINCYFLLDYTNGISSVIFFHALAISFQWLSADRLTLFSLKWAYVVNMGGWGGGDSKVRVASLLLGKGCSCPDLLPLKWWQKWVARA